MFKLALFNWIVKRFFGSEIGKLGILIESSADNPDALWISVYSPDKGDITARAHLISVGSKDVFSVVSLKWNR